MNSKLSTLLVCFFLSVSPSLHARRTLSLEQCVDSALALNPALRARALEVKKAQTMQGTAFNPSGTEVTLSQITTEGGGPDNGLTFSQEFDFPTMYVARSRELKAETELSRAILDESRAQIRRDVMLAYDRLLFARRKLRLAHELDTVHARFSDIIRARFSKGEISRLDLLNTERSEADYRLAIKEAEAEYAAAGIDLQRLTGTAEPIEPDSPEGYSVLPHTMPEAAFNAETGAGALVADRRVALSERSLKTVRQEYLPSISVGATTQLLIKGFNPYDVERERFRKGNFMGFEVGVKLPLFFGATRAREKSARQDVAIANIERENSRLEAESAYASLLVEFNNRRSVVEHYRNTAMTQADEIARLADVSYHLGEISMTDYLLNMENVVRIRTEYAAAVNSLNQTIIKLNYLQGKL